MMRQILTSVMLVLFVIPTLYGMPVRCVLRRRWHAGCVIVNKEATQVMKNLEHDVVQLENCE